MIRTLLILFALLSLTVTAHAQLGGADTKPGDSCSATEEGYVRRNASADRNISEITLICDGSQWQSATGAGLTTLQGQDDPGPCTSEKDGLIRYRPGGIPKWHYCDGGTTSWLPFRLPQCQDDDAGECTLAALRSSNDPQFKPSSIRCGDKLLGVTGTYGSGSSSPFSFPNVTNANLSALTTASAVTISGIPAGCGGRVEVAGQGSPLISVNGGAWTTSADIANGQTLVVRLTASGSYSTAHTATIAIGSTEETWSVTTRAANDCTVASGATWAVGGKTCTAPSALTITHGSAGSRTDSTEPTTGSASWSCNDGTATLQAGATCVESCSANQTVSWSTNCSAPSGALLANDANRTITNTAAGYAGTRVITCNNGIMNQSGGSCTGTDTTPEAFTLTNVTGANPGTATTSNIVTISGITTATAVSATNGAQFNINGGGWVTSGSITNGQTLQIRLTASGSFSTAVSTNVTVGTVTQGWSVTTRAAYNCSNTTISWSPGCSVASGSMTHGEGKSVSNTASGYTGTRNLSCNDGAISQSGGSCTATGGVYVQIAGSTTGLPQCNPYNSPHGHPCPTLGVSCVGYTGAGGWVVYYRFQCQ